MQSLLGQLQSLPKTGELSDLAVPIKVAKLVAQAQEIRQQYPQLANQAIALTYTNLKDIVIALIAFDGWCSELYLCPPEVLPANEKINHWPMKNFAPEHIKSAAKATPQIAHSTLWYIATSGTTGEPKWYSHSFESLSAGVKYSDNLQLLSWGLMYQPYRFAGLQVVLQALLSGANLVDVSELTPLNQLQKPII